MDAAEAKRRQAALGTTSRSIDLGGGLKMELVLIPPGEFVMGDAAGAGDERPACRVKIPKPFWMGRFEVTNAEFARFDPAHDSRVESKHAMQFGVRGFYVNGPRQPVVRVNWHQAMAFAAWLSARTGERLTLPTEAQWEYACRAGTATPSSYGGLDTDFSRHANLADRTLREFVCDPYNKVRSPFPNPAKYDDWIPKDERFTDGGFVSEEVGRWQPNAWGLHDAHGNAAEWTRSAYRPYPYRDDDGRNEAAASEPRVVRGGSWRDKPREARSASRLAYRCYQPVYNVGFRVVSEVQGDGSVASR
jgi:formylglycine-generating enzyme required for sulfatase activity